MKRVRRFHAILIAGLAALAMPPVVAEPVPGTPGEEGNRIAIAELQRAIDESYSYRDLRGVAWDKRFRRFHPGLLGATTPQQFAERAAIMLSEAQDPHIWLSVDDALTPTFERRVQANQSLAWLELTVPRWQKHGNCVVTGLLPDSIGYVMIRSWGQSCSGGVSAALAELVRFSGARGVIVDVRSNTGGDESLAAEFAGVFVTEPVVYARHMLRDAKQPGGFTDPIDRTLRPNPNRPHHAGPVAVLSGPAVMSSCESFLLMMRNAPNVTLVGDTSFGSSGSPRPHHLSNGVTVNLPTWKDFLPDGTLLEGHGVEPDIRVKTSPADFDKGDPVLDRARELLLAP